MKKIVGLFVLAGALTMMVGCGKSDEEKAAEAIEKAMQKNQKMMDDATKQQQNLLNQFK